MFDGQSLGYTPFTPSQAYPAKFMRLAHGNNRHFVTNLPGTTYAQRAPSLPGRVDHLWGLADQSVLIDDGGSYDIDTGFGGMTSAQLLAAKAAYTAARRAAGADRIVALTIPPATIITAGEETIRQEVNAALKAAPGSYGYDQVVDVASIPQLMNPNDVSMYFDGTHWTDAATTYVAEALRTAGV